MFRAWPFLLVFVACGRWGVEPLLSPGDAMDSDAGSGVPSGRGSSPPVEEDDAGVPVGGAGTTNEGGSGGFLGAGGTAINAGGAAMNAGGAAMGMGGAAMGMGGAAMGMGGAAMGMGGAAMGMGGAAMGMGGAAMGMGGAAMGMGGIPAVSAAVSPFYGMWKGTARNGSINYPIEISVVDRAPGKNLGLFHVVSYDCGGFTTLNTVGATLVYKESLIFDLRSNCGPAGTTTLTPTNSTTLGYSFFDGKKTDKGTLTRASTPGSALPSTMLGLWSGTSTNVNPSGTQTVNLAMVSGNIGTVAGHITYPSKSCGGTLTLSAANAGTYTFSEKLSRSVTGCTDGNTITISVVGAQLKFHWAASSGGASGDATLSVL
jgi:hypothetical protein